jgi:hypothetical protein
MRGTLIAFAVSIGMLSGVAGYQHAPSDVEGWREIAWPFARDGWPSGRAFRCDTKACGEAVEIYVRPKIGFCNCDSGVVDDDEVDRVADLDLISERFVPVEAGHPVQLAEMRGRLRAYELTMADRSRRVAVGIAVSRGCDLLVAVAHGNGTDAGVQDLALKFLGSSDMMRWMPAAISGR